MTATLPPEYALSSSGSSAGSRANSDASTPSQSSLCPSKVISPGRNSASTRPPPPAHVGASPWCSCAAAAAKRATAADKRATSLITRGRVDRGVAVERSSSVFALTGRREVGRSGRPTRRRREEGDRRLGLGLEFWLRHRDW